MLLDGGCKTLRVLIVWRWERRQTSRDDACRWQRRFQGMNLKMICKERESDHSSRAGFKLVMGVRAGDWGQLMFIWDTKEERNGEKDFRRVYCLCIETTFGRDMVCFPAFYLPNYCFLSFYLQPCLAIPLGKEVLSLQVLGWPSLSAPFRDYLSSEGHLTWHAPFPYSPLSSDWSA